jgi:hypothetical protein
MNFRGDFTAHEINTDTLDNFCNTKKVSKIDVLKIDVEGSELEVLFGAKEILKQTNLIQIEILDLKEKFDDRYLEVKSYLEKNYQFKLIKQKNIWSLNILSKMKAIDALFIKNTY